MNRKQFIPCIGERYKNAGGGEYACIEVKEDGAVMRNIVSGWTLKARGCGMYDDGTIDWDYSLPIGFRRA